MCITGTEIAVDAVGDTVTEGNIGQLFRIFDLLDDHSHTVAFYALCVDSGDPQDQLIPILQIGGVIGVEVVSVTFSATSS